MLLLSPSDRKRLRAVGGATPERVAEDQVRGAGLLADDVRQHRDHLFDQLLCAELLSSAAALVLHAPEPVLRGFVRRLHHAHESTRLWDFPEIP